MFVKRRSVTEPRAPRGTCPVTGNAGEVRVRGDVFMMAYNTFWLTASVVMGKKPDNPEIRQGSRQSVTMMIQNNSSTTATSRGAVWMQNFNSCSKGLQSIEHAACTTYCTVLTPSATLEVLAFTSD